MFKSDYWANIGVQSPESKKAYLNDDIDVNEHQNDVFNKRGAIGFTPHSNKKGVEAILIR